MIFTLSEVIVEDSFVSVDNLSATSCHRVAVCSSFSYILASVVGQTHFVVCYCIWFWVNYCWFFVFRWITPWLHVEDLLKIRCKRMNSFVETKAGLEALRLPTAVFYKSLQCSGCVRGCGEVPSQCSMLCVCTYVCSSHVGSRRLPLRSVFTGWSGGPCFPWNF